MSSRSTELRLIALIEKMTRAQPFPNSRGVLQGLGDDTAALRPPKGSDLAITEDAIVENVHFHLSYTRPYYIGRRLAASNLSDMAASGAEPLWATLTLGFRAELEIPFFEELMDGMLSHLRSQGVTLVGGDTVRSSRALFLSMTMIGRLPKGKRIQRSGAKVGDLVFCSGNLGDSQGGLIAIQKGPVFSYRCSRFALRRLIKRHLDPIFRLKLGMALLRHDLATSVVDVSDGLSTDLSHVALRSQVRLRIFQEQLPISRDLKNFARAIHEDEVKIAITGGEDFELIWTSPPEIKEQVMQIASKILGHAPFVIGEVCTGKGVYLVDRHGREEAIAFKGYEH